MEIVEAVFELGRMDVFVPVAGFVVVPVVGVAEGKAAEDISGAQSSAAATSQTL